MRPVLSCNKNISTESALIKNIYKNDREKFSGKHWETQTEGQKQNEVMKFQADITEKFKTAFGFTDIITLVENYTDAKNHNIISIPTEEYKAKLRGQTFEVEEGDYLKIPPIGTATDFTYLIPVLI